MPFGGISMLSVGAIFYQLEQIVLKIGFALKQKQGAEVLVNLIEKDVCYI